MNLWLRLIWLFLSAPFRAPLSLPGDTSVLSFRVLPHDLDLSGHMNNGRYLTIMDLGRIDLIVRSGLGRAVWRRGWTPMANAVLVRFRRELRVLEPYHLKTRVVSWQEQAVLIEQTFVFAAGERAGQIAAQALVKGTLYDRTARRHVPVAEMMAAIGVEVESPPPSAEVEGFLGADRALREAAREQGARGDA